MAAKLGVLFAQVPQLVRDMLAHEIARQPDMHVLPDGIAADDESDRDTAPEVVIVGTSDADAVQPVTSTLWRWPRSQVLMVTIDGRQSALYRLEPQRTDLGELSPSQLVEQIRSAVRRRAPNGSSRATGSARKCR